MSRPKSFFTNELAQRAQTDLDKLDEKKILRKLQAIVSPSKYPISTVADITGVAVETIWRWALSYVKSGVTGLYPKARRPKPSKLIPEQKAAVLSWLSTGKTPKGENTHWTLERLRYAIAEEYGVTLGINTIWVWLRKENWKLKVPRPKHYKADIEAQQEFKKN